LRGARGVTASDRYRCDPTQELAIDIFVDPGSPLPVGVSLAPSPRAVAHGTPLA
jgi:hypothetical protein